MNMHIIKEKKDTENYRYTEGLTSNKKVSSFNHIIHLSAALKYRAHFACHILNVQCDGLNRVILVNNKGSNQFS
jgi:hypothetical protein